MARCGHSGGREELATSNPEERGSRGTGFDQPSAGPSGRPSGTREGDESVPTYENPADAEFETAFTNEPPGDVAPEVPPYEERKTSADSGEDTVKSGARVGGAAAPTTDPNYKSPAPDDTPGGATTSPADEQPATEAPETERGDEGVGPTHVPGVRRGEQQKR